MALLLRTYYDPSTPLLHPIIPIITHIVVHVGTYIQYIPSQLPLASGNGSVNLCAWYKNRSSYIRLAANIISSYVCSCIASYSYVIEF